MNGPYASHKGFTLVEVLVVVALIAMVGAGVYVWQQSTSQTTAQQATTQTETQTGQPTPPVDIYLDWKTYAGKAFDYTIKYPPNYSISINEEDAQHKLSYGSIKNAQGQDVVKLEVSGWHQPLGSNEDLQNYIDKNVTQAIALVSIPSARFEYIAENDDAADYWSAVVSYRGQMINPLRISIPADTVDMATAKLIVNSITGPNHLLWPILSLSGN